jgi:hypothetical protein
MWQIYALVLCYVALTTYVSASHLEGWKVYSQATGRGDTVVYAGTLAFYERVKILREPSTDHQLWLIRCSIKIADKRPSVPFKEKINMRLRADALPEFITLFVQSLAF